jgi:hypothetical protein
MHRVDGPAYLVYKQGVEFLYYYLLSKQVTKEQFETPGFIDAFILENS